MLPGLLCGFFLVGNEVDKFVVAANSGANGNDIIDDVIHYHEHRPHSYVTKAENCFWYKVKVKFVHRKGPTTVLINCHPHFSINCFANLLTLMGYGNQTKQLSYKKAWF